MNIEFVEIIIRWLGGALAYATWGFVLFGIWRGTQRQAGRAVGLSGSWLRNWRLYLASSVFFFGVAYLGWIPLKWMASQQTHTWMLMIGSLFYFPGMSLLLWARLTLGKNYFVSTGFGAQLFAGHQLVTTGPYAFVRHPMYVGLIFSALGSLLIYVTWTTVYFVCFAPLMFVRAYREEFALSAEFGEQWVEYCKRVPAFFPRLKL